MQSIDSGLASAAFREQPRPRPALVGAAVAISAFMLGLALLPQPGVPVAALDGPEAIDMMGPQPVVHLAAADAPAAHLPVVTGVFEESPPEAIVEVWG